MVMECSWILFSLWDYCRFLLCNPDLPRTYYVAWAGFELDILMTQASECWDYMWVGALCLAASPLFFFFLEIRSYYVALTGLEFLR